jgi:hypothetical protein
MVTTILLSMFEKENKMNLEQAIITRMVFTFIEKVFLAQISVNEQPSLQFLIVQSIVVRTTLCGIHNG